MSAYRKPAEVKPLEIITEKKPMDQNEMYVRGHRVWGTVLAIVAVCGFVTIAYAYHVEPETIRAKKDLASVERDIELHKRTTASAEADAAMQRAMAERAYTDRVMFESLAKKDCK